MLTYRDLLNVLQDLSVEQLDQYVTIVGGDGQFRDDLVLDFITDEQLGDGEFLTIACKIDC